MCGIAGLLGVADEGVVRAMTERIAHRGPDGVRVETLIPPGGAAATATLGHARLSIIDLECGWQPLHAAGSTVIGNGEIYNYRELIAEHGLEGALATGSDFEPLLHLYAREGERAFARLRGMYAFCLVGGDGRTWLVRDPFGIKPLHLREDARGLAFASEPRALGTERLTQEAAEELLALNYRVSGRNALAPGEVREVSGGSVEGGEIAYSARAGGSGGPPLSTPRPPRGRASAGSEADLLARLDAVLEDSVAVHQRSDVPYGLFLSGGVDSAVVATLMARLNSRPVTAFTCGFEAPGAPDERAAAERVARALDLDWRETTFAEADFWRVLPEAAWALDDPTCDYAVLPTWKLGEAARGVLTVVLTGEGGDELFAGYGRYRRALRPRWLGGRPAEPQVDAPWLPDGGRGALARWRSKAGRSASTLLDAQQADLATWLPHDLLLKLDRCLMAHGLEGRTPFLDSEVAAFALALPDRFKVRGRWGKWLLRRWLERACPAAAPWARKQGFTVPVEAWIAPRARELGGRLGRHEGLAEVCDMAAVRAAFADDRASARRWPLLFYATWWNIHVAGMTRAEAALQG